MATQVKNGIMPKKKRFSLVTYIKETKQELKRVTWPTKGITEKYRNSFNCSYFVHYISMAIRHCFIWCTSIYTKIDKKEKENVRITRGKMVCSSYLFRT